MHKLVTLTIVFNEPLTSEKIIIEFCYAVALLLLNLFWAMCSLYVSDLLSGLGKKVLENSKLFNTMREGLLIITKEDGLVLFHNERAAKLLRLEGISADKIKERKQPEAPVEQESEGRCAQRRGLAFLHSAIFEPVKSQKTNDSSCIEGEIAKLSLNQIID